MFKVLRVWLFTLVFAFRNEALRVAFIHVEESGSADGTVSKEFFSKLVKADIHGKDQVGNCFYSTIFFHWSIIFLHK